MTHALLAAFALLAAPAAGEAVRMNQIQVIGTHNSYHAGLTAPMATLMRSRSPTAADSLDYSHPSLTAQLDAGVRQVELDVFADTQGGRYAHPQGASAPGAPAFDPQGLMRRPGFKVLHVQDLDYVSTCQPFAGCLGELRAWSRAHPGHAPIFVLVETKASTPRANPPLTAAEPFTPAVLDALDAEVRAAIPAAERIAPDDVRGGRDSLADAVAHGGWPTLAAARGKLVFLFDQKSVGPAYLTGHPALRGRALFTNAEPGAADAAFVERNDAPAAEIADLVRRGYLVRTRADADTRQARTGDTTRRDEALRSGAQMVSTDYPASEPSRWTGYHVALPGGAAARCNPVNAPAACAAGELERSPEAVRPRASSPPAKPTPRARISVWNR